ncbi:MAG: hypothetical protein DME60_09265 [Verrucomicrobia bacterium]|nr:MAG: hypothetical protein DME60_09265 [Verrucomicrobiota bacterium]
MERRLPDSARVPRVGERVSRSRTFLTAPPALKTRFKKSSFRRDAETSTRDACATHKNPLATEGAIRHLER